MKWLLNIYVIYPIYFLIYTGIPLSLVSHVLILESRLSFNEAVKMAENLETSFIYPCCLSLVLVVGIFFKVSYSKLFSSLLIIGCMAKTIQFMMRDIDSGIIAESVQRIEDYFLFRLLAFDLALVLSLVFIAWWEARKAALRKD